MSKIIENKELSKCHKALVSIGGDFGEGTHYYVCNKCGKACDLYAEEVSLGVKVPDEHSTSKQASPDPKVDPKLDEIVSRMAFMAVGEDVYKAATNVVVRIPHSELGEVIPATQALLEWAEGLCREARI